MMPTTEARSVLGDAAQTEDRWTLALDPSTVKTPERGPLPPVTIWWEYSNRTSEGRVSVPVTVAAEVDGDGLDELVEALGGDLHRLRELLSAAICSLVGEGVL